MPAIGLVLPIGPLTLTVRRTGNYERVVLRGGPFYFSGPLGGLNAPKADQNCCCDTPSIDADDIDEACETLDETGGLHELQRKHLVKTNPQI